MDINYQRFSLGAEITDEQHSFFNRNGFIHFKNFIEPETVNDIIRASKQVEQNWIQNQFEKVFQVFLFPLDGSFGSRMFYTDGQLAGALRIASRATNGEHD